MTKFTRFRLDACRDKPKPATDAQLGRTMGLELGDMHRLAQSLMAAAALEPEEAQVAVAWLARNVIAGCGRSVDEGCARLRSLLANRAIEINPCGASGFADKQFCRTFSILCRVWAGDLEDPTSGATTAHRHDETPSWAEGIPATALIGPWVFYRPD
jgi:hypothetical protein